MFLFCHQTFLRCPAHKIALVFPESEKVIIEFQLSCDGNSSSIKFVSMEGLTRFDEQNGKRNKMIKLEQQISSALQSKINQIV